MSDLLFNPGAGAEDVFFQTVFCATAATIVSVQQEELNTLLMLYSLSS